MAIFQSNHGQKLSFFSDSPWNSVWRVLGGVKDRSKTIGTKFYIWFWDEISWFERMVSGRNLPYGVFFVHLWYMYVLNEKNLNALWVPAILQAFEVDLFWRFWPKSPFLVIDSYRTKHSQNIIECVLESPMLYLQNKLLQLDISHL